MMDATAPCALPTPITLYGPDQDCLLAWLEAVAAPTLAQRDLRDRLATFLETTQAEAFVALVATETPDVGEERR